MSADAPVEPVPAFDPAGRAPTAAPREPGAFVKLCYASSDFNLALTFVVLNSWLLYFLVNVAELPPVMAGVAFVAGRLFDAVLDVVVGRWSDRLRPRHGRLVLVRWGLLPAAVAFVGIWWLPVLAEAPWAKFAAATAGFMAYSFFYTLTAIPRHAMLPDLAPAYDARTRLIVWNMMFVFVAVLIAVAITPALVLGATGALGAAGVEDLAVTPASAWILVTAVFAAVGVLTNVPVLFFVPDPRGEAPDPSVALPPSRRVLGEVRSALASPGVARVIVLFFLSVMAVTTVQSMTPFYLESVLGVPGEGQAPVLLGIFVLSILFFPVWSWVATRTGKARGMALGIAVYAVFLVAVPFVPRGAGVSAGLIGACIFAGIGVSALNLFPNAMLPDAVDMDSARTGRAREGLIYAMYTFGQKIAGSIGVFFNAIMLAVFDHRAGQVVQDEGTLAAFVWMTGPVPLAILLLSALLLRRYPVDAAAQAGARDEIGARDEMVARTA